jgi:hypothetical protein
VGDLIGSNFIAIREWLLYQLNSVISHPIGSVTMEHIDEVYTLDYIGLRIIYTSLFSVMKSIEQIGVFKVKAKELGIVESSYTD